MPAIDSLNEYRASVIEAESFITTILQKYANGRHKYPLPLRSFVVDSSFLKIFIAWETFLESIFMKYMMGENPAITPIVNRYANPMNRNHANDFLLGTGTKTYIDWSTPDTVRRLSTIYFGNANILNATISSIHNDLLNLKTIRNAAAHMTSTTSGKLDTLASNIIGPPQVGMIPSKLLLWIDPIPAVPITLFSKYINLLDTSAELIVNG